MRRLRAGWILGVGGLLVLEAGPWCQAQVGARNPKREQSVQRQVTGPAGGKRSVEIRREPGHLEREVATRLPNGAFAARSVDLNRKTGNAQVSTQIVGPRGATFERDVRVHRSPGGVERQIHVQRPGGASFDSAVRLDRGVPGPMEYGPIWGLGGPPPTPVNTSFGFFFGNPAPPPPLVAAPIVVGAPLVEVVQPPPVVIPVTPYRAEVPPQVIDPVQTEIDRLSSFFGKSRREACERLGRLGDNRALPPLMERLKQDRDTDVRVAAARALGEIGDPASESYLKLAQVYDKKEKVREEARLAMARLETAPRVVVEPAAELMPPALASQPIADSGAVPVVSTPRPPEPGVVAERSLPSAAHLARRTSNWPPRAAVTASPAAGTVPPAPPAPAAEPVDGDDPLGGALPPLEPAR